jgi:hypothetical protein
VIDKTGSVSPKPPAVRQSRRHSPWPIVIVVALPIFAVLLRLPMWVTLVVLVVGTVSLAFSPHLRERRVSDPRKAWLQLMAYFARLQSAHAALKESPADAAALERFAKLQAECLALLSGRRDSEWGKDADYVAKVRKEIADMSASVEVQNEGPAPASSQEAGRLGELKRQGPMSDGEFSVLSEKLKVMAADKASTVLEAVAAFQLQYRERTVTEEGFHAVLWNLLDNLGQGDSMAQSRPAATAQPEVPAGS